jgi:hypothetical protein
MRPVNWCRIGGDASVAEHDKQPRGRGAVHVYKCGPCLRLEAISLPILGHVAEVQV